MTDVWPQRVVSLQSNLIAKGTQGLRKEVRLLEAIRGGEEEGGGGGGAHILGG
jgi:hypothetical protein